MSFEKPVLTIETQLITTTIAQPTSPVKNKTSIARKHQIASGWFIMLKDQDNSANIARTVLTSLHFQIWHEYSRSEGT